MDALEEQIYQKLEKVPVEELRGLHAKLKELEKREGENLAETFIPNVKAEQFIKQVGENKHFINIFFGGNGTGKSSVAVNIIVNICFGAQKFNQTRSRWQKDWGEPPKSFFDYPLYNNFSYLKKGRIISDPTTIKEKIIPELKKWMPSNRYKTQWMTTKEGKTWEAKWKTDTGFEWDIMSNEQEAKEFESADCGWVWFDEPSRKEVFKATVARMRLGGIIFWTVTPLTYAAWMEEELYNKRDGKTIEYVTASTWDNCSDIPGTRGILTKENIEKQISQYSEDEKVIRVEGRFGKFLGRVHKGFERRIHVIPPFELTPKDYCVARAIDTHPRVPDHVLYMAVDRKGIKYFCGELVLNGTVNENSQRIKDYEKNWRIIDEIIDPSAFNNDVRTIEKPIGDQYASYGVNSRPGSKDLLGGIRRTDEALKYIEKEGHLVMSPEVYFLETVPVTINQLENYIWDEYKGKSADDKDPKPHPLDKNDHQPENLHRLLMLELQFKELPNKKFNEFKKFSNKKFSGTVY